MYEQIIDKYYGGCDELRHILLTHSQSVVQRALRIAANHPNYTSTQTLYLRLPCFTTLASYVSTLRASIATALSHTSDTACAEPRFCATSICPKATHACASDTQEPDSHSTTSCRKTCPYPITTCSQRPLRRSLYATPTSSSLKLISTAKKTYNRQRRASQSLEATPWHGSVR